MISGLLWVVLVVIGFVGGCFGFLFAVWLSRFRLNTCVCILSSCVGLMLFVVLDSVFKLCLDLWVWAHCGLAFKVCRFWFGLFTELVWLQFS